MKKLILILFLLVQSYANAGTTLACASGKKCDAYFENCVPSDFSFSVFIEPKNKTVSISSVTTADFTNPAEVRFNYLGYRVIINRYEYSATLFNDKEAMTLWCKKTNPAW